MAKKTTLNKASKTRQNQPNFPKRFKFFPNLTRFYSGPFPVTVTLNTNVNPTSVQVNATNNYTISGTGSIAGSTRIEKNGSGTLTLAGTNTYTGGTLNNGGQLNINYGGDGINNSAIGTGPLTNTLGSKLDNTSGHDVTLLTPIAQYWSDDFSFMGTYSLNMGPGAVTLGSGSVNLTVSSNVFEVDGVIGDNGLNYGLAKSGPGTLTLSNNNSFAGGMLLNAGTLNVSSGGAVGAGTFTINGGAIDNTSGDVLSLSSQSAMQWNGSFTFVGSTNMDFGSAQISVLADGMVLTVNNNTLTTGSQIGGGNRSVRKAGPGNWTIAGGLANSGISIAVDAGTLVLNKDFGANSINANALTVNTNGTVVILNPSGTQFGNLVTIAMSGGLMEWNGDTENFSTLTFNSGRIRNNSAFTTAVIHTLGAVSLVGAGCEFEATNDANITIAGVITNIGGLVKLGGGLLTLSSNNTYTGNTTVSNGTLALNFPCLATNSTVTVASNAVLNLSFANSETNLVTALVLGGVNKPGGIYNATTDPLYISGTGSLQVPSSSTINPAAGVILSSYAGGNLNLAWPTNAGWLLQTQTNSRSTGLSTNWSTVLVGSPGTELEFAL